MRTRRSFRRIPLLLACLMAGCHLVDQRDFDSTAGQPPKPHIAALTFPVTPSLVTIRYATPNPSYREAVANAVQQALARKRDVLFTVTTLVPPAGISPEEQAAQAAAAAGSGREVAQTIVDSGAEPGQVEQTVKLIPGLTVKEVLVSVH